MAGRIPQNFIDDLLDRTDIVETVDARVKLKKTGKNYTACCPFHDEKTPSFSVNPEKQFYYCFGCGAAGNAIGFVMEYDNVDFRQAVEILARQTGMEIPQESVKADPEQKKRMDIYSQLDVVEKNYRNELKRSVDTIDYLKLRGISGTIARDFGLGYAPDKWDHLTNAATSDEITRLLVDGGMLIEREQKQGFYDRFRNRLMFPIRDQRGRTIAFGGRVLDDQKPKYLNSPETAVFQKSRELYGLYEMIQQRTKTEFAVVVEGYMDVVALAQFDIKNAVATLGTSVGQAHLEKLFRYVSKIVFCFDGDDAGRKAAERALDACLPTMLDGRQVSFLFLPEGEDPDTLVQTHGKAHFLEQVSSATSLSDFMFQKAQDGLALSNDEDKLVVAHRLIPEIQKLPSGLLKNLIMQRLSDFTGLTENQLFSKQVLDEVAETYPETTDSRPAPPEIVAGRGTEVSTVKTPDQEPMQYRLVGLILQNPKLVLHPKALEPEALDQQNTELFKQVRNVLEDDPDADHNTLITYWMGFATEAARKLSKIYAEILIKDTDSEILEQEFTYIVERWSKEKAIERIQERINELQAQFDKLSEEERKEIQRLFAELSSLKSS